MVDAEAAMLMALEGKFFWEPTSSPNDVDSSAEIRRIQRKIAGKGVKIISTKLGGEQINTESIKPMTRILKGEEKVLEPIIKAITKVYDVSPDDLVRSTTSSKFAKAKHHLYWALFKYIPNLSYTEAGRLMKKCRTTVMHGKAMFEKNMDMVKVVEVEREMGIL